MSEETNNLISLIVANHNLGHVFAENCEFDKGLYHIEKALEIVEMGNVLWSIAMHKACIAYNIYFEQGRIDLAYQTSKEALALAEESGDILSKTEANANHGICCFAKGFLEEAEKHLLLGRSFSERANLPANRFAANIYLGEIYIRMAEYREAQQCFANAISIEKLGIFGPSLFNLARVALTSAKVLNHEEDIDRKLLTSYVSQNKLRRRDGLLKRQISEILLNNDNYIPEAEDWIQQAIDTDNKHGAMFELGICHAVWSEIFKRKGDRPKTREKLGKAIEILKECGADGWVEKYQKEFAEL